MRHGLAPLEGQKLRFRGTVERFGVKPKGYNKKQPTVILVNVHLASSNVLLAEHCWVSLTKAAEKAGLAQGQTIEFSAKCVRYKKGRYRDIEDFKLSYISGVTQVEAVPVVKVWPKRLSKNAEAVKLCERLYTLGWRVVLDPKLSGEKITVHFGYRKRPKQGMGKVAQRCEVSVGFRLDKNAVRGFTVEMARGFLEQELHRLKLWEQYIGRLPKTGRLSFIDFLRLVVQIAEEKSRKALDFLATQAQELNMGY